MGLLELSERAVDEVVTAGRGDLDLVQLCVQGGRNAMKILSKTKIVATWEDNGRTCVDSVAVRNCWALRMCRPVNAMSGLLILNAIA
jgi:hypothetical protein